LLKLNLFKFQIFWIGASTFGYILAETWLSGMSISAATMSQLSRKCCYMYSYYLDTLSIQRHKTNKKIILALELKLFCQLTETNGI